MENGQQVATKADLAELKTELKAELKAELSNLETRLADRFDGRMDAQEQRLRDHGEAVMRDMETRLLQAFYGYAETNNRRIVQIEAGDAILAGRVVTLESRVLEIEKRLNIPPTA